MPKKIEMRGRDNFMEVANLLMAGVVLVVMFGIASLVAVNVIYKDDETESVGRCSEQFLTREDMVAHYTISSSVASEEAGSGTEYYQVRETSPRAYLEERFSSYNEIPLDDGLQIYMQRACKEYKVGFAFALAIMESESSFEFANAGDGGKSIGYMQINKPNWYRYGLDAHYEIDNIEIGIRMLGELIEKYGEIDAVVMAYKGGESFADSWIEQGRRLEACDVIVDRAMYWQSVIDGEEN